MGQVQVQLDDIEDLATRALVTHGAEPWIAESVAHAIRIAEATNNRICGLYYLESYCVQLVSGRVKGTVDPEISLPKPASVMVDAKFGFAQSAFLKALPTALDVAREMGTASLAICHAHTCTSLGYFTEQIANNGLIGIGFTNAPAVVAPPQGKSPVLGTNPIAMAVPQKGGGVAFQFDQSTSAIAIGKITMAASANEEIPLGWAIDENGEPTTDPHAALRGSLVSSGGYKGFGFGLMAEVMAAALTGTVLSTQTSKLKAPEGDPHNLGQFYLLIDPETFAGDLFYQKIEALKETVNGADNGRLPGSKRVLPEGVMLDEKIWQLTQDLASKNKA